MLLAHSRVRGTPPGGDRAGGSAIQAIAFGERPGSHPLDALPQASSALTRFT